MLNILRLHFRRIYEVDSKNTLTLDVNKVAYSELFAVHRIGAIFRNVFFYKPSFIYASGHWRHNWMLRNFVADCTYINNKTQVITMLLR